MGGVALIFPGQNSQQVGMGRDVAEAQPAARAVFDQADRDLGIPLSQLCFEGPAERLSATDVQQPAIFATSVALLRAALESGIVRWEEVRALAGLSLGEYTALHAAGALSLADGLRVVLRRGQLMQQCCDAAPSGMVSLLGMEEPAVLALCEKVRSVGVVGPANFNCPGQIVISGEKAACEAAAAAAEQFGGKAVPLRVAGAFHSELMRPAAEALRGVLDDVEWSPLSKPVISNVDASYHSDPAAIRALLVRQVYSAVRWQECVERLIADGCDTFIEIGPGRVLTGLMRKINRNVKAINVSSAADLAQN